MCVETVHFHNSHPFCRRILFPSTVCSTPSSFTSQDCSFSSMTVPWCLQGSLVHNVVVALCLAGLMHRDLTLLERCQAAVAGFCLLDIFQLLASAKAKRERLVSGSLFMARQTVQNLQACALSALIYTVTKPVEFGPFAHGTLRMSEQMIEGWFGTLRVQSQNAQLSARSYWQAAARRLLRQNQSLNKLKIPRASPEKPLADREYLRLKKNGASLCRSRMV